MAKPGPTTTAEAQILALSTVQKYRLLDPARGLAALAVVFFHRGVIPLYIHPLDWLVRYGQVGANIFFVISGYVIYQSMERRSVEGVAGCWTFIKKRCRRIYPPFWASLIISFLVSIFILRQHYTLKDYLGTLTLTFMVIGARAPQVIYWTLALEEQFYALMTVLIVPVFNRVSVILVLLSTPLAIGRNFGRLSNWFFDAALPSHWFEFELGILVYFILHRKVSRIISLPVFVALLISGLFGNSRTIAPGIFAVLIIVAYQFDATLAAMKLLAPVRWLGLVSYSLYLVHLPILIFHDAVFVRFHIDHEYLKYFSGLVAVLVGTVAFFWLFERPFLSASQKQELTAAHLSPRLAVGASG